MEVYRVQDAASLSDEAIIAILSDNKSKNVTRINNLKKYYREGTLDVIDESESEKPVANYAAYITDVATGYFLGKPVQYTSIDAVVDKEKPKATAFDGTKAEEEPEEPDTEEAAPPVKAAVKQPEPEQPEPEQPEANTPVSAKTSAKVPFKQQEESEEPESDINALYLKALRDVFDRNGEQDKNNELGKEASICGRGFEYVYMNEQAEVCFCKFETEECVPIYGNTVEQKLLAFLRTYKRKDWAAKKPTEVEYVEIYDDTQVRVCQIDGKKLKQLADLSTTHSFGEVPIIEYKNNEDLMGDFEKVLSLINAYNRVQFLTKKDLENFTNALLVIVNMMGTDSEDLKKIVEDGAMKVGENGDAHWLVKEVNDQWIENFKNRLRKDIHTISKTPDLTDQSFSSNESGVAMEFKLWGLNQITSTKGNKFTTALKKRIRLITKMLIAKSMAVDSNNESQIKITYQSNVPKNLVEMANIITQLSGKVSDETLLALLPFVADPAAEIKRLEKKSQELAEKYNLGFGKQPPDVKDDATSLDNPPKNDKRNQPSPDAGGASK